jgi:hypothetical protein
MFCPQCSNEILSERARFCTRCSFPLAKVKEVVETEVAKSKTEEEKKKYPLRQKDISFGAGLMIIGLIQAIIVSPVLLGGNDHELLWTALALGLFFSATLMYSQSSPRHRGLTLGATMIFLGYLIGTAVGLVTKVAPGLLVLPLVGIFLLISLFWTRLSGAFSRLFFDEEIARESPNQAPLQPIFKAVDTAPAMLPQMQSSEVVEINPQEMKTKEPVQPFSITEDSTSLLNKG